jgi:prevent-host-death family protein
MTILSTVKSMPAGEFKAKCLGLLDRVERTGETLIVTKRGRPVAQIAPLAASSVHSLRGSVTYDDDILAPLGEAWDPDL